ncbi:hypothetical protein [Streptomyces sp. NPDC002851]
MAILNLLPRRLWDRAALAPEGLLLRTGEPAAPNAMWSVAAGPPRLAEVALGGLLEPWGPGEGRTFDALRFEFRFPAGGREALRGGQLRRDVAEAEDLVRREVGVRRAEDP